MDGKICVKSAGFSVELSENDAYGAFGLVKRFSGLASVVTRCWRGEAKASMDLLGVGANIISAGVASENVGSNGHERGAFGEHASEGDDAFKETNYFGVQVGPIT